jgi:hypothetical protein
MSLLAAFCRLDIVSGSRRRGDYEFKGLPGS